jgi:hypothetical protein
MKLKVSLFLFLLPSFSLVSAQTIIPDESASNWVVDCFAGNSTTGNEFYQGPALEVGGLATPGVPVVLPNGTAYLVGGPGLAEISPNGKLQLIMGDNGLIEGPIEQCVAGSPIWSIKDSTLYITGPNCLRKIVTNQDGSQSVEVVAGIPNTDGSTDGIARSATFPLRCMGIVCDSQGTFYWLQVDKLRRIKNDSVTTLPLIFIDLPNKFNFQMGENRLSRGETDNILYVSDFFNGRLLKYIVSTGELTRFCGTGVLGDNVDGQALTTATANSGFRGHYDPFHNCIWVGGPDENRFRWMRLSDGWVKTVIGANGRSWNVDGFNNPANNVLIKWNNVSGFDDKGGVYISGNPTHSVWRAYNTTEVQ